MRLLLPVLILSVVANILFGWHAWSARQPAAATTSVVTTSPSPTPTPARPLGERIDSDDPATFTAHLRELGLPPSLLNAVVSARLRAQFEKRMHTSMNNKSDKYWISPSFLRPDQIREYLAAQTALDTQLRELLGPDHQNSPRHAAEALRRFGPIDSAKIPALEAILRDYEGMRSSYRGSMFRFPGDEEARALIETEKQADLAALLSPAELFEYNLRHGDSAGQLRTGLGVMNVSEAEFRAILPLWEQMPETTTARRIRDPLVDSSPAEIAAREALVAQATNILGPERASELAQALTPQAYSENRFVARIGLPVSAATTLHGARVEAMTIMKERLPATTPSADLAARAQQAREIVNRVTTALGEDNAQLYESTNGSWLTTLKKLADNPTEMSDGG